MEENFLKEAASANLFEQQFSEEVQKQAQDQKIKSLAQQIIQDHKQAQQQLQQVAQSAGVQLPNELNEVHKAKLQEFQKKQGRELELSYLWDQIGSHTKAVLKFRYMADHAQNPQVQSYARKTGETLQQHLSQALECVGVDAQKVTQELAGSRQQASR